MNSTETREGRKLIAVFIKDNKRSAIYSFELPEYNTDWNELMHIVTYINEITFDKKSVFWNGISMRPQQASVHWKTLTNTEVVCKVGKNRSRDLLEAVFKCVVEFIKYYNKQKQQ